MRSDLGAPVRAFFSLVLTLAVWAVWPGENGRLVRAQEDERTIFVRLLDSATEAPVTDLMAEDFAVWQAGVECELVSAELVSPRLQLALVFDESQWMRPYVNHVRNGVSQLLDALPEGSEVSLIATDPPASRITVDFTTDMALVRERLDEYFPWDGSLNRMLDTLHQTADNLLREDGEDGVPEGGPLWPAIAVIGSNGNEMSEQVTPRRIYSLGPKLEAVLATVHWVMLEFPFGSRTQPQLAEMFTHASGGWHDRVTAPSQIAPQKMAEMGAAIAQQHALRATQYRVVFKPLDRDSTEDLSVAVARPETLILMSQDGRLQ
mgnify:FL=1